MSETVPATRFAADIERTSDAAIVRCRGKLVAGVHEVLYGEVRQLMPDAKRIVLDLTELTKMDSMGLGVLARLYVSAKSSGCQLELMNIGPSIRKLLGITNMLSVFTSVGENGIRMP